MDRGPNTAVPKRGESLRLRSRVWNWFAVSMPRAGTKLEHEYDCPYQRISYPTGPRTTPLIPWKVYTLGTMGNLFCLDAKTGKPVWSKSLNDEYECKPPIWGHAASLLLDGNRIITLAGGDGSAVVTLDKDTGKEIWKALTSEVVCYCPPTIVEAGGKRQLIIWLSDTLNSLDPETGNHTGWSPIRKTARRSGRR